MKARNNEPPEYEELFSRNVGKQIIIAKYFVENIKIENKKENKTFTLSYMGHVTEESLHVCVVYLLSSVYTMNLEIHHHHHHHIF